MKRIKLVLLALVLTGTLISAQSKFGVGINAGLFAPTGDFNDVYKSGFGGLASLTYDVNSNLQVSLTSGFAQFSFNNDKFNELLNAFGITQKAEVDSKLNLIPVVLGGKYFISNSSFRPYGEINLGLHLVSVGASSIKSGTQTYQATKEESKAATAWGIGVGFLYNVAPKINLDVNAKFNGNSLEVGTDMSTSTSTTTTSQSSKSTSTFFTVTAGLHFEL